MFMQEKEKTLHEAVVCFLIRDKKILLAKKGGEIGKGLWNGYGGGIENRDKNEKMAAVREVEEESGGIMVLYQNLEKVADTYFKNTKEDGTTFVCHVAVFLVRKWIGVARTTEEMLEPTWFDMGNIPKDQMLPADKIWLPVVLSGKKIIVNASYGPHQGSLIGKVGIQEVNSF